jgi:DNA-binding CsgD family transcriptional regulator
MANDLFSKRRLGIDSFYLTPAEIEVLRLLGQGHDLSEVAQARCVSVFTVKAQLRHAHARTCARTTNQLVALVARADALGQLDQFANPRWPRRAAEQGT